MSVREAFAHFAVHQPVARVLQTMVDVGLDYIRLGQPATTLSGGEAQRIKLSRELAKRGTGNTLYILDEPSTGLHFEDVRKLLEVLARLVDAGNTVVVIEHNLDIIKTADWSRRRHARRTTHRRRHARNCGQSQRQLHRAVS